MLVLIGKFRVSRRRQEGVAAVELALCLIPLILILAGVCDFGGLLYTKMVLTSASREGARYATRIQTDANGQPLAPSNLLPSVSDYVLSGSGFGLQNILPANANPTVTSGGAGYTSGAREDDVSVQVSADWYWLLLSNLLPGFPNPQPVSSTTVMKHE
jgi:hypothetical protein